MILITKYWWVAFVLLAGCLFMVHPNPGANLPSNKVMAAPPAAPTQTSVSTPNAPESVPKVVNQTTSATTGDGSHPSEFVGTWIIPDLSAVIVFSEDGRLDIGRTDSTTDTWEGGGPDGQAILHTSDRHRPTGYATLLDHGRSLRLTDGNTTRIAVRQP